MLTGEELFVKMAALCNGHERDAVLSACINILTNCVRQHVGRRAEALDLMQRLYGTNMEMLMEHYDSVTGRRRSVIPFTQTVHMDLVKKAGAGNGHT